MPLNARKLACRPHWVYLRAVVTSRTAYVFFTNAGILICGLATSVLIGRVLGPEGRGEIAAVLLWPVILVVAFSTGLIPAVLYFTAGRRERISEILGTAAALSVPQIAGAVVVGYFAMPYLLGKQSSGAVELARLYLIMVPFCLWTNYGWSLLQAQQQLSSYNILRLVTPAGYACGALMLVQIDALSTRTVVYLQLGLTLASFVLTGLLVVRCMPEPLFPLRSTKATARKLLRFGTRVQVGDLTQTANVQLDQMLIAATLPPAQLGLYTAAFSVAGLAQLMGRAVRPVLVAKVANCRSIAAGRREIALAYRRYGFAACVTVPSLLLATPSALSSVYGPDFRAAALPAIILVFAAVVLGAKEMLGGAMQAMGHPWLNSKADLIGAVVTASALPLALRGAGITGAAVVSLVAYSVQLGVLGFGMRSAGQIDAGTAPSGA